MALVAADSRGPQTARWAELPDVEALRTLAAQIRQHSLDHLDHYLGQLKAAVQGNRGRVHFAADAEAARRIVVAIAALNGARLCVKTRPVLSQEVGLTAALRRAGIEVLETHSGGSSEQAADAQELTEPRQPDFRDQFRRADLGIAGANFLVAETGHVCLTSNDAAAEMATTLPRVLVCLAGIEQVIPRMIDLSVMLKLLERSATGQELSVHTTLVGGPRGTGEKDGPEQFHLVLLDGGRSDILAGPFREVLRCIRCAACADACPVCRNANGPVHGAICLGPIGAVVTPLLSPQGEGGLAQACARCSACRETCPVKINLPEHLLRLRHQGMPQTLDGRLDRAAPPSLGWRDRAPFRWAARMRRWLLRREDAATGVDGQGAQAGRMSVAPAAAGRREGLIETVRQAVARSSPLSVPPVAPEIDEPVVRLVHSDIGLPELFTARAGLHGISVEMVYVGDLNERLGEFLRKRNCRRIALPVSPLLEQLEIPGFLRQQGFDVGRWDELTREQLDECDCSVTDVYSAVAETGSLVVRRSAQHGRGLSLVPPLHVTIVEPRNCVPDLVDLFEKLGREAVGSSISLITGVARAAEAGAEPAPGVQAASGVLVFVLQ